MTTVIPPVNCHAAGQADCCLIHGHPWISKVTFWTSCCLLGLITPCFKEILHRLLMPRGTHQVKKSTNLQTKMFRWTHISSVQLLVKGCLSTILTSLISAHLKWNMMTCRHDQPQLALSQQNWSLCWHKTRSYFRWIQIWTRKWDVLSNYSSNK